MTDMATVATNLRDIEDMADRLEDRAIDRATDRLIPGGEAMVALGGVGSIKDWTRRVDIIERTGAADTSNEDPDELWPALQVLWFWSEDYREQLGHNYEDPRWRPTLISEAKFLRNHDVAEWIWNNELKWDGYAADVARAKAKLESILHEGNRSERTPVVCDKCDDKRALVRVYADREHVADECGHCGGLYDPDTLDDCPTDGTMLHPVYNSDPADDRWKCMGCKHLFTLEELDDARGTQMRRSEPREWVSRIEAIDILCSMGHQRRTAAGLADVPEAAGWKHEVTRVRYVSWPDVWRAHLLALQAARNRHEDAERAKAHKAMCKTEHDEDCWIDGRGCSIVCPRGSECEWFMCPVHNPERVSA